jgi:hypothetical protein
MSALDWLRIEARRHYIYDRRSIGEVVAFVNQRPGNTPFRGLWTPRTLKLLMGER